MKLCNQCQRPMEEGYLLRSDTYGSLKLEPGRPKPGGIRAAADGLLAGLGRTECSDIRVTADFAARGVWAAARCIVSMRVGDIMLAAAKAAGRKKRKEGLQWKSIPSRA